MALPAVRRVFRKGKRTSIAAGPGGGWTEAAVGPSFDPGSSRKEHPSAAMARSAREARRLPFGPTREQQRMRESMSLRALLASATWRR